MNIPLPPNEKRRLEVLWQYDLLDTPPEQPLDDLADLARSVCETPVALISLVDEKRLWFKAHLGISETEAARDISFCTHAILKTEVMIVPDALTDPRFATCPLVTSSPFIRFYAGAPLITQDGHALGALCIIDQVPHQLTQKQVKSLETLARVVMSLLDMRRRLRELSRVPIRQVGR